MKSVIALFMPECVGCAAASAHPYDPGGGRQRRQDKYEPRPQNRDREQHPPPSREPATANRRHRWWCYLPRRDGPYAGVPSLGPISLQPKGVSSRRK